MQEEYKKQIRDLIRKLPSLEEGLCIGKKKEEIEGLEKKVNDPSFWNDPKGAGQVTKRLESLRSEVEEFERVKQELEDFEALLEMAESEEEKKSLEESLAILGNRFKTLELTMLFSGEYDEHDAIVTVRSGAGGVDAQDWAEMLLRMLLRWCERNEFSATILEESRGTEAGIKSVTIEVTGLRVYGRLRGESGVHRLVRLSPFNSDNLRQTSFAQVDVIPKVEDDTTLEIADADLRIDTYRASGAGGQHVNKTDSAVRITHIPTGLVAACQSERSQMQNKEHAMTVLKAKLLQKKMEEQEAEKRKLRGESVSVEWGSQIRSYVLHPYKLVKDHRTGYETAQTDSVLDGDIDAFIEQYLIWRAKQK